MKVVSERTGYRKPRLPFGTNHSEEGLADSVMRHVLMEPTMRWIVFVLWLLLTPIWIGYSSSVGSGSRVAFIPPALALIALVSTWLWKRLVVCGAGEVEPLYFHPHWGLRTPIEGYSSYSIGRSRSRCLRGRSCGSTSGEPGKLADQRANGNGRIAIIFGGAKSSFHHHRANRTRKVARAANIIRPGARTSLTNSRQKFGRQNSQRNFAAGLPHCGELNGTNFYFSPQNRVVNLQDYRRSLDNLVTQGVFPWNKQDADARWAQVQKQATTDQANCTAVASLPSLRQKLKGLQQRQLFAAIRRALAGKA
jgi:hypothetical protein